METISIENLKKCDYKSGNTYDDILVEDKKNKVTLLVVACPLDCGGTIDWSCIIGYDVYVYTGKKSKFDEKYLGHIKFMNPQSLRRLYAKTLPLVVYNNPYGDETDMLRKRVNPNAKGFIEFGEGLNGYYRFEWNACCGAAFMLEHKGNGEYELSFSGTPDNPISWSRITNFKVE
jgi:hypothetical protein